MTQMVKHFDGEPYLGKVTSIGVYARIVYEDGDTEDLTMAELEPLLI